MSTLRDSDLLNHVVEQGLQAGAKLDALKELSEKLNVSTGKLREQLEVARVMGLVDIKPRTGIRLAEFDFAPAVRFSLLYALAQDHKRFDAFSELRTHVEFGFFHQAVSLLTNEDCAHLKDLIERAWAKLEGAPARIPHPEHRDLHLTIYKRLDNPFVRGLLEAYWDAYEAEGLSVFADIDYLHEVWTYHEGIVNSIIAGDIDEAYQLLVQHTKLLQKRPSSRLTRNRTVEANDADADDVADAANAVNTADAANKTHPAPNGHGPVGNGAANAANAANSSPNAHGHAGNGAAHDKEANSTANGAGATARERKRLTPR